MLIVKRLQIGFASPTLGLIVLRCTIEHEARVKKMLGKHFILGFSSHTSFHHSSCNAFFLACSADSLIHWFTQPSYYCTISCFKSRRIARIYVVTSDWLKLLFDQTQGRNNSIRNDYIYPCDSARFETRYRALIRRLWKPTY